MYKDQITDLLTGDAQQRISLKETDGLKDLDPPPRTIQATSYQPDEATDEERIPGASECFGAAVLRARYTRYIGNMPAEHTDSTREHTSRTPSLPYTAAL